MKTSNPFDFDLASSKPARNAFDITHSQLFTSPCGALLPVYRESVLAGDYIEMKCSNFTRTQPSVAPAFVTFDEKIDFYFVPYRLLWSLYDSWRLGTNIYPTSALGNRYGNYGSESSPQLLSPTELKVDMTVPSVAWNDLVYSVFGSGAYGQSLFDIFGYHTEIGALRLFDFLGYGALKYNYGMLSTQLSEYGWLGNARTGGEAYQFPEIYDLLYQYSIPALLWSSFMLYSGYWTTAEKAAASSNRVVTEQEILSDSAYTDVFEHILSHSTNLAKLGYPYAAPVALWYPLAYQCIYNYFYRNTDFEPFLPENFNVDARTDIENGFTISAARGNYDVESGSTGVTRDSFWLRRVFELKYRNFRRDRFNSVKPVNGFGFNALQLTPDFYDWLSHMWAPSANEYTGDKPGTIGDGAVLGFEEKSPSYQQFSPQVGSVSSWTGSMSSSGKEQDVDSITSANQLRILFATDAMTRAMVYSKKEYKDLMKAEFGVDTRNILQPLYLGTHENSIQLSDVAATVENSDTQLGQLAGKGIGGNSSFVFKQKFDEDGVILGIHSIMPRNNYDSTRIDDMLRRVARLDMPFPQTSSLGLQPIGSVTYSYLQQQQNINDMLFSMSGMQDQQDKNSLLYGIFGYESRFGQYKSRVNEIHGPFQQGLSLDFWTVATNINTTSQDFLQNAYDNTQRYSSWSKGLLSADFFKCRPGITDQIFNVVYDGFSETDPFMCSYTFDCQRVSNLPVLGVPSVNDISL